MTQDSTQPHLIRSKDNDFFKLIKSYASAKARKRDRVLLAEGEKTYAEALATLKLRNTIVAESYFDAANPKTCASPEPAQLTVFADSLFDAVADLKTSQGIIGVFEQPTVTMESLDFELLTRVVVLDGVQDPSNVGAIIRSAHCLGFQAVLLGEGSAQPFSPKVIRSSMGSVFHVPVIEASVADYIAQLKAAGFAVVGTALSGSADVPKSLKLALLIGSEGRGLSPDILEQCDHIFSIKMSDSAESLNAAVASGIAMYVLGEQQWI